MLKELDMQSSYMRCLLHYRKKQKPVWMDGWELVKEWPVTSQSLAATVEDRGRGKIWTQFSLLINHLKFQH